MARLENTEKKIEKLIESGRLYYSQPTQSLVARLKQESEKWRILDPSLSSSPRPWGSGPNESSEFMTKIAQNLLYGLALPIEHIQRISEEYGKTFFNEIIQIKNKIFPPCRYPLTEPLMHRDEDLVAFIIKCHQENILEKIIKTRKECEEIFWMWVYEIKPITSLPVEAYKSVQWMTRIAAQHDAWKASRLHQIPAVENRWNNKKICGVYIWLNAGEKTEVDIAERILADSKTTEEAFTAAKAAKSLLDLCS